MATIRDNPLGVQLPLFGEDRLKAEVRFNGFSGWEWIVQHRYSGIWYIIDSGLAASWNSAIHHAQRVIGELDDTGG